MENIEQLITCYDRRIEYLEKKIKRVERRIYKVGTLRLLTVAAAVIVFFFFRDKSWMVLSGIGILFVIPFALMMISHNSLFGRKKYLETLVSLIRNLRKAIDYDFSAFDGAADKIEKEHPFALDLDLFGEKSIFQMINRTVTAGGREKLAQWLQAPLESRESILKRQDAIRELAGKHEDFEHFYVIGKSKKEKGDEALKLEILTNETAYFDGKMAWKILLLTVPAVWILLIGGAIAGWIPESVLAIYAVVSLGIGYWKSKEINLLYNSADKIEGILSTYAELMKEAEYAEFESEVLKNIQKRLQPRGRSASVSFKTLSWHIRALNQRFSLAGVILNVLFLRDVRHALALERWKARHHKDVGDWLDALAELDALYSLGSFAFNHPGYIFPEITDEYFRMEGKDLGHPLLNRDACVRNDIRISNSPQFLIITGANMAGKSTYLRTVGINFVLACVGAPVCARSLTICPARLTTSLRTSDSLSSNESYFFAELKRLKMIIDRLKQGEKLFIILDEILKGTNSIDKQKGSLALMKQLVAFRSYGIIATHDLVLGGLEKEFPGLVKNYRFEADIVRDELNFPYRLREGVAQNMNACFLMKKMGITVE